MRGARLRESVRLCTASLSTRSFDVALLAVLPRGWRFDRSSCLL